MTRACIAFLVVLSVACHAVAQAEADTEPAAGEADDSAYEALVTEALRESAAGRWEEARVLFRRAHVANPNARTLRGIGMVAYELRDYPDAVRHLVLALNEPRRALTEEQRAQAEQLLQAAYSFVGRYDLANAPVGAQFAIDGQPADLEPDGSLVLPVGTHRIVVRTASRSWEARLTVRGGEHEPLPMIFEEPVAPPTLGPGEGAPAELVDRVAPDAAWAMLGTGAGVAVIGVVLFAIGLADFDAVENATAGREWADLQGSYDRAPVLTSVGLAGIAVGVATMGAGALWAAIGEERRRPAALRMTVLHDATGAMNGIHGTLRMEVW